MTSSQVITIVISVLLTYAIKEFILHFFSPNKKVNQKKYDEDQKMIHERISKNKTISDESFHACKKHCQDYTDRAIQAQKNDIAGIKDLFEAKFDGLNHRFDDLMNYLKSK